MPDSNDSVIFAAEIDRITKRFDNFDPKIVASVLRAKADAVAAPVAAPTPSPAAKPAKS